MRLFWVYTRDGKTWVIVQPLVQKIAIINQNTAVVAQLLKSLTSLNQASL
jgi:hypothetical protein